mmetsp:Transcript_3218/g.19980  ORF Transcript_3218/g.19980 Transcript_3218/m.19980 type:complete len:187 (+) Transcript_3218:2259-2819(+)
MLLPAVSINCLNSMVLVPTRASSRQFQFNCVQQAESHFRGCKGRFGGYLLDSFPAPAHAACTAPRPPEPRPTTRHAVLSRGFAPHNLRAAPGDDTTRPASRSFLGHVDAVFQRSDLGTVVLAVASWAMDPGLEDVEAQAVSIKSVREEHRRSDASIEIFGWRRSWGSIQSTLKPRQGKKLPTLPVS